MKLTKEQAIDMWLNGVWCARTVAGVMGVTYDYAMGWFYDLAKQWKKEEAPLSPFEYRDLQIKRDRKEQELNTKALKLDQKRAEKERKKQDKRIEVIRERFLQNKYNPWELSKELNVSVVTIRHDLEEYRNRARAGFYSEKRAEQSSKTKFLCR